MNREQTGSRHIDYISDGFSRGPSRFYKSVKPSKSSEVDVI